MPASQMRSPLPRRDRFAAAREIPGNAADDDPLYTATDEELAGAAQASSRPTANTPAPEVSVAKATALPSRPAVKIPAPDEVYREATPQPVISREPAIPRQPARPDYLGLDPITDPVVQQSPQPSTKLSTEPEEPAPRRTGVWIGSVAAAAVLAAAGFLYVNGLPSMVTEWVSGSRTSATSSTQQTEAPTTSATPTPKSTATLQAPAGSFGRNATAAGGLVGARENSSATPGVEKTSGPTFVPGGVMDGYLISAPRPQYPQLANLAGIQGKISFEAMISKSGDVEALKVLGGPQLLRSAATDAVRQWQYRPFEIKGRPVEVRTIIRVDVGTKAGAPADQ